MERLKKKKKHAYSSSSEKNEHQASTHTYNVWESTDSLKEL